MSSVHFRLGKRLRPCTRWYKFYGCGERLLAVPKRLVALVSAMCCHYPFFARLCSSVNPVEIVVASGG